MTYRDARLIRLLRDRRADIADLALAIGVALATLGMLVAPDGQPRGPLSGQAILFTLLSTLPLFARRRRPFAVLAVTELGELLYLLTRASAPALSGLGTAIALYTVTTLAGRRLSLRIACLTAGVNIGILLVQGLILGQAGGSPYILAMGALVLGSWSLGENVRTRRAYLAQLEERARRLEQEGEEEARRAVRDERARIARELHDIVAHHVSAIAVQAGAAEGIAERNPGRARETLRSIQETSRQALTEMRAMLNVLRGDDEVGQCRDPQPSLAQVARLVSQSEAAGLPVTLRVEGGVRSLPEALEVSAYRIIQEALTNSLKHAGPTRACVVVRYAADMLELEINDQGVGSAGIPDGARGGRGLIGMRERVALFGGDLAAAPAVGQGFQVRARLPLGGNEY